MIGTYHIAGLNIRIESCYPYVHSLCADYFCDSVPDLCIATSQADITFEREKSTREDIRAGRKSNYYSDDYLESLAVYRKIAEKLPEYSGFVFHGSAIAVDGDCYLFTAKSGTGKSTHTRLWRQLLGSRAVMVNDDKPIIRLMDEAKVFGTPWDGKHHLSSNISVPLKAICILERSEENHIQEISYADTLPMLIQQAYRPENPGALEKTIALLDGLNVRLYLLRCNMEISAASLSYGVMSGSMPKNEENTL